MRGSTISGVVLVALLVALAIPDIAPAATAVRVTGNTVRASSDPGEANEINVDLDLPGGGVVVADDSEGVTVTPPCILSAGDAECPLGSVDTRVIVKAGNGNDTVTEGIFLVAFAPFLKSASAPPIVFDLGGGRDASQGGFGPDRIIGGTGNDLMIGLDGSDTLIGGPGNDFLDKPFGGGTLKSNLGRDRYLGGPGADKIRARDFTRDIQINCGPGRDKRLGKDRFDPKPVGCP